MLDGSLPHRNQNSRRTHLTETQIIHQTEDSRHKQAIRETTDPNEVLGFLQNLIEWYESDVDSRAELPLFVTVEDSGFVYVRDNQGGEYVMWSVNEWIAPKPGVDVDAWNTNGEDPLNDEQTGLNTSTIPAVVNAIKLTYEQPSEIMNRFDRTQIESCSPN